MSFFDEHWHRHWAVRVTGILLALASSLSACTAELLGPPGGHGGQVPATGGQSSGGAAGSSDLPCQVQALLAQSCQSCHSASSALPLASHADLTQPSSEDPSLTMSEAAVLRMGAADQSRMPPSPFALPDTADIEAFSAWVEAGSALGSCGQVLPPPPDPYDTPVVCTSSTYWSGGDRESPNMYPGQACIACHTSEDEGPDLAVAGTIYPTAHEPDDCNGVPRALAAYVVIVDAAGRVFELATESSGNFMLEDPDAFTPPYRAKVVVGAEERVMVSEQEDGDCNGCHTEGGDSDAPGRIMGP